MRLSIVVPVLDSAPDLARLLDALIPQLRDDELIVVNDGSSDPRVRELLASQPRIVAVHHDRIRGSSAARNSGLEKATAERVLFIDADCVPAPGSVEAHRRFHDDWPDEVCVGDIQAVSTRSVLLRFLERGSLAMFGFHDLKPQHGDAITYHFFYTANASVPRAALRRSGVFDDRYSGAWDDIELGQRLDGAGAYPHAIPALNIHNQYLSLTSGLRTAKARASGALETAAFLALDVTGRCCFWGGYIAERSALRAGRSG
jgi:glycosyltransferase involved in cell wall biosynthesis